MKYIWVAHHIGKHRQALAELGGEWDDHAATFWFTDGQLPALKAYVSALPDDELVIVDNREQSRLMHERFQLLTDLSNRMFFHGADSLTPEEREMIRKWKNGDG